MQFIRNTRLHFREVQLGKKERGPGWADQQINLRLPVSLSADSVGTSAYAAGGWGVRPESILPLTEAGEKYWVAMLVGELNREFNLALATAVSAGRTLSAVRRLGDNVGPMRFACLGASNAGKTAVALQRKGVKVVAMVRGGWRVSEDSIEAASQELKSENLEDDILVLHCLDSRSFYVLGQDGSLGLPIAGRDGIVHVGGRVSAAKGLQLETLMRQLEPLLTERRDKLTLLVSPCLLYTSPSPRD